MKDGLIVFFQFEYLLKAFARVVPVFLLLAAVLLSSCRPGGGQKLAEVNGDPITNETVQKAAGYPLSRLEEQIYQLKRERLDELISEEVLANEAKKRGISVSALLEKEVNSKILPVANDEIEALYKLNKARIPVELSQVQEQLRNFIKNQRIEAQRQLFIQSLRAKAKVVIHLKPPPPFRVQVSVDGAPFRGPQKAAVTLIKFEDFECPFCKKIQPVFGQLLSQYEGKLKLVHRDFPIAAIHPQAEKAAEASRCANEQGKFWSYHDKVYASAPKLKLEDLTADAKAVGLDVASFERCLNSAKFRAAVQKDVEEATRLGITGTPAFFINGRPLGGAQPLEAFTRVIDEELARAN